MTNEYRIAEGPEGLTQTLADFLEKSRNDAAFAKEDHFILYQVGAQQSLILVDSSKMPFQFWHYDLMGRPSLAVTEMLQRFLVETSGVEGQVSDLGKKEFTQENNREFLEFGGRVNVTVRQHSEAEVKEKLLAAKQKSVKEAEQPSKQASQKAPQKESSRFLRVFSVFGRKAASQQKADSASGDKPGINRKI